MDDGAARSDREARAAPLAARPAVSHPSTPMAAFPYKLLLLALLALAANACLLSRGQAGERCDERKLPNADTVSVEAAARKTYGAQLPDLEVHQACIRDTYTSVRLIQYNRNEPNRREWWNVDCDREQSTWFRRGGWKCSAPKLRRGMEIEVSFEDKPRTVHIAFGGDVAFEAAEGLTRRAFALFEEPAPAVQYCTTTDELWEPSKNPQADLKRAAYSHADLLSGEDFSAFIERTDTVFHLQPFSFHTGFAFEFPTAAAADPAHASGCWGEWFVLD